MNTVGHNAVEGITGQHEGRKSSAIPATPREREKPGKKSAVICKAVQTIRVLFVN